jgi:hypothetical protein
MKNKIIFSLLSKMFFNAAYYQLSVPKLLIGKRCFKVDFDINDGSGIIIRNYDNYSNQQTIYFNTQMMRVNSMTQYSEKESDICLSNFMYRTVILRKARSDFDTCKMFNQFNLYVHYIMFSFNYMYWR